MYLLIPHSVSDTTGTLWIAVVDEQTAVESLQLEPNLPNQAATPPQGWPQNAAAPAVKFREVDLTNLSPGQTYAFQLKAGRTSVASAKFSTLPQALPLESEKPFTVLLGSCFAYLEDEDEKVGNTYLQIPTPLRPDVKILAGDQVYLDSPWYRYLSPHSIPKLQAAFLKHYRQTWGQPNGFGRLLREGANFFTSDDHEYWNNAPNSAPHLPKTWTVKGRSDWLKIARELFVTFQTRRTVQKFLVPPVSFLILDTRLKRTTTRTNFSDPADLQKVADWVNALQGPGVLVIGQPILRGSTGHLKGHLADWNLPDYQQYDHLTDIVGLSQHSLLILTGDVHYGRVALTTLRSGAELVEIISSPMSLVEESAKGQWQEAPPLFPPVRPSGSPLPFSRSQVTTEAFASTDGHFLTLEFTRRGAGAHIRLRYWPIIGRGIPSPSSGKLVWERTLHLGASAMILMKKSPSERPNPKLREEKPHKDEGNKSWLVRHEATEGVILLGGALIPDFRIRVAQSELRHDMSPSHWSLCGILVARGRFASVTLNLPQRLSEIPKSNAIRTCRIDEFDDPKQFPNIAFIRFAQEHKNVRRDIRRLEMDRSILDIPTLILPWLGFVWGTAGSGNPLKSGLGLPSAAFVETVFAIAGFELTPGLSSASSCPEAIWQSARWWNGYFEEASKTAMSPDAVSMAPEGVYTLRQEFAAPIE